MKKFLKNVLMIFLFAVGLFIVETLVYIAIKKKLTFEMYESKVFWYVYAILVLIGIAATVFRLFNVWERGRILKVNDNLEESRWLNIEDVKKNENLTITTLKKLPKVKGGIPVYAKQRDKKDLNIILARATHVLVIGTTGSGKTSGFLEPEIEIFSRQSEKPSMIIADPKGEIYAHRSKALAAQGYKIKKIDLSEPYASVRWNPFSASIRWTDEIKNCTLEDGAERNVYIQERRDKIFDDLKDIIDTICPIESKNDPGWEKAARDFILAMALLMQDAYLEGEITALQFNLTNLYKNVLKYTSADKIEYLKKYFLIARNTQAFSQAQALAQTVIVSDGRTLTSYLSEVNKFLTWLVDNGIAALTSSNEIEIENFDEEPTALFIIVPEEKETRNKLVTLFVTQLYKELLAKAKQNKAEGKTKEQELLRTTYFLLDEFGNLPPFPLIDKIITAGRSRKIFIQAIIQDYAQLEAKYGKEKAAMIKSNCNVKIFIGSTDAATLKEYSELCGKVKVKNISYGGHYNNENVNVAAAERPLVHPSELARLNDPPKIMGNAVVLAFGKYPLKAVYTPIFKTKAYETAPLGDEYVGEYDEKRYFDIAICHKDVVYRAKKHEKDGETQEKTEERPLEYIDERDKTESVEAEDDVDLVDLEDFLEEEIEFTEDGDKSRLKEIYSIIDEELNKFKDMIADEDLFDLKRVEFSEKISILQELANKAQSDNKRILAIELSKYATMLEFRFGELIEQLTPKESENNAEKE